MDDPWSIAVEKTLQEYREARWDYQVVEDAYLPAPQPAMQNSQGWENQTDSKTAKDVDHPLTDITWAISNDLVYVFAGCETLVEFMFFLTWGDQKLSQPTWSVDVSDWLDVTYNGLRNFWSEFPGGAWVSLGFTGIWGPRPPFEGKVKFECKLESGTPARAWRLAAICNIRWNRPKPAVAVSSRRQESELDDAWDELDDYQDP